MSAFRKSFVVVLLALTALAGGLVSAAELTVAQQDAKCRPFFHDACAAAFEKWMPEIRSTVNLPATPTHVRDAIAYHGRSLRPGFGVNEPADGTFVIYGMSGGGNRQHIVYDRLHRLTYFSTEAGSVSTETLAMNIAPPPRAVRDADLSGIRTLRRIRLGQTIGDVRAVYGPAKAIASPDDPKVEFLHYSMPLQLPAAYSACTAEKTLRFYANRLVAMEFENAC